jgi:hypothetical protein
VAWLAGMAWIAGIGAPAAAQSASASMQVLAEVSDIQISIAALAQLRFGDVVPGTPRIVDPGVSVDAGKFEILGARRAEFTLSLTLPALLRAGSGPYAMPIAFGPTAGCYYARDRQNQCAVWDPGTALTARIRPTPPPNNTFYVWLGGTVTPAAAQVPGVYSAVVTASVAYTGN